MMRHTWPIVLAIALGGCAVVPDENSSTDPYPADIPRRTLERYRTLDRIVLDDAPRRWIITPDAVLELVNGSLSFEYAADEGIMGTIQAVSQGPTLVWVATNRALQSIDKSRSFVRTYIEEASLDALFVEALDQERAVSVCARGVVLLDGLGLAHEIYPLDGFTTPQVLDVALVGDNLWIGTRRGLKRFSVSWKTWNDSFGGKPLRKAAVIRLEVMPEYINGILAGESLFAVTTRGIYIYRPTFDTWERLGF